MSKTVLPPLTPSLTPSTLGGPGASNISPETTGSLLRTASEAQTGTQVPGSPEHPLPQERPHPLPSCGSVPGQGWSPWALLQPW